MRNVHFVTYASGDYQLNWSRCHSSLKYCSKPDTVRLYNDSDFRASKIFKENRCLLKNFKSYFYIWKPWLISERMKTVESGDIIWYHDCGKGKRYLHLVFPTKMTSIALQNDFVVGLHAPWYGYASDFTVEGAAPYLDAEEASIKFGPIEAVSSFWVKSAASEQALSLWMQAILSAARHFRDEYNNVVPKHFKYDQSVLTALTYQKKWKYFESKLSLGPKGKSFTLLEILARLHLLT